MKIKKILCLLIVFVMFFPLTVNAATPEVGAPIAILMDGETR